MSRMPGSFVRDYMTSPAVTDRPDISVTALVAVLRLRRISAVPIVEGGNLVGIVSMTDILRAPPVARARDIMTSPVITIDADASLEAAAQTLTRGRVHRAVVLEGGRVVGVLSARDLLGEITRRGIKDSLGTAISMPVDEIDIAESVEVAVTRLASANLHGLVVVEGNSPVGVFTQTEALAARRLAPELRQRPVETMMSYETIFLDVSTPIARAAAYARVMDVRRVLVVDHRQLVGVVSCLDLLDALTRSPANGARVDAA